MEVFLKVFLKMELLQEKAKLLFMMIAPMKVIEKITRFMVKEFLHEEMDDLLTDLESYKSHTLMVNLIG